MDGPAGAPWPGGQHGEVISPTGRRAYLAGQAGRLAGFSQRWATDLASRQSSPVDSERGHIPGRKGAEAWFLIADTFEQYLQTSGRWPPATAEPAQDFEQLVLMQGADLEAARRREQELQARVDHLEQDRNELLDTIASLSATIATLSKVSKTPPRS